MVSGVPLARMALPARGGAAVARVVMPLASMATSGWGSAWVTGVAMPPSRVAGGGPGNRRRRAWSGAGGA